MPAHPDEFLWSRRRSPMGTADKTIALVLFVAACSTTFVAYVGYRNVCLQYEGAVACLGRPTEFALSLALTLAGLVAAGLMLHFAFRGPRRLFVAFLVVAVVLYAASILFGDAGTHGWDGLEVFPNLG